MIKPSSLILFSCLSLSAFLAGGGCSSDSCGDTDSCGDFPRAGTTGTSGSGGTAGKSAGTSGKGDSAGKGGTSGDSGSSGAGTGPGGDGGTSGTAGSSISAGRGGRSAGGTSGRASGGDAGDQGGAGAGMGGTDPCDGACKGATPVCDADTGDCVECTKSSHCDGDTPACDTSSHDCVECTATDTAHCQGDTPLCDTDAEVCVGCLASDDCSLTTASRCDTDTHACAQCSASDDCTHLAGTAVCASGTCVECTAADESACGADSCNPATNACTDTPRGSVGICEPCLADSECAGGDMSDPDVRCVPMEFQGVARAGGFCLRRVAKTCSKPYQIAISVESLSGTPSEAYCGIDQETTRCEAVLDLVHAQPCADGMDTSCGCSRDNDGNCAETGQGGLCRTVGVNANQCTYECGLSTHCPTGTTCDGTGTTYCQ